MTRRHLIVAIDSELAAPHIMSDVIRVLSEGGVCVRSCCGTAAGEVELASMREERDAWQQAYYAVRALQEAQVKTPAEVITIMERTYATKQKSRDTNMDTRSRDTKVPLSSDATGVAYPEFAELRGTGRTSASSPNVVNAPRTEGLPPLHPRCPDCKGSGGAGIVKCSKCGGSGRADEVLLGESGP